MLHQEEEGKHAADQRNRERVQHIEGENAVSEDLIDRAAQNAKQCDGQVKR